VKFSNWRSGGLGGYELFLLVQIIHVEVRLASIGATAWEDAAPDNDQSASAFRKAIVFGQFSALDRSLRSQIAE
jgi:hypothetical protein